MKKGELSPELAQEIAAAMGKTDAYGPEMGICLKYECELVTPMFGGGVVAGEVDRAMPVRATAIRGQLRFWWRLLAMHGPRKLSGKDLFVAERGIWGGLGDAKTLAASKVQVRVRKVSGCKTKTYASCEGRSTKWLSVPGYALFSAFQEQKNNRDPKIPRELVEPRLKFTLEVQLASKLQNFEQESVKEAIRWWASFGGLGARTRRGVGAVKVGTGSETLRSVSEEEVQSVGGEIAFYPEEYKEEESAKAWDRAVKMLKCFRQDLNIARKPSSKSPAGQSFWPEPYAIREICGTSSAGHAFDHPAKRWFPRAAFGLPIVFQFKDKGDPENAILQACGHDRMASPLILRPYWDGKCWRAAALLLPGFEETLAQDVKIAGNNSLKVWPQDRARQAQTAAQIPPMRIRDTQNIRADNPLQAFLQFFREGI